MSENKEDPQISKLSPAVVRSRILYLKHNPIPPLLYKVCRKRNPLKATQYEFRTEYHLIYTVKPFRNLSCHGYIINDVNAQTPVLTMKVDNSWHRYTCYDFNSDNRILYQISVSEKLFHDHLIRTFDAAIYDEIGFPSKHFHQKNK